LSVEPGVAIYIVRYEAVNAMLLNEFLKEHRKVEKQETNITEVKSTIAKHEAWLRTISKLRSLTIGRTRN
jgi:hypothetical protein